jgi:hypothetical protein
MAKYGEEKIAKAMKEAKTAEEMYAPWGTQRPGFVPPPVNELDLYKKEAGDGLYLSRQR